MRRSLAAAAGPGVALGPMPHRAAVTPAIPAIFGSGPPWWLGRAGGRLDGVELLLARNPDPDSRLPYLLLLPLADGMVFRASGTWPRTSAVYCYPVTADEWPDDPDIVDRAGVRSCV